MTATDLLNAVYRPLIDFAAALDEATGWTPTQLPGWTVRDLIFHVATDAQRALVALATPADGEPDIDEVSYWTHWQPGTPGAEAGLRGTRIMASAWSSVRGPADLYAETARAVLVAATRVDPAAVVATQGHRLTVDALVRTLAIEATVHWLDLAPALTDPPPDAALDEVRRVLEALLGRSFPADWEAARCIVISTGRAKPTETETVWFGADFDGLPLFG